MAKFLVTGKKMRVKTVLTIVSLAITLSGCLSYDLSRQEVQQGNLLPEDKLEQLKIGMSKEDTANLMGTSLLSPLFNNNRWDYAYTLRIKSAPLQVKTVTLFFEHDQLVKIDRKP